MHSVCHEDSSLDSLRIRPHISLACAAQTPVEPPLPEGPDRWKLGIDVAGVELSSPPERNTCYMLHVDMNGRSFQSRSHRCAAGWVRPQLLVPLNLNRDVFCGPGSPIFAQLHRSMLDRSQGRAVEDPAEHAQSSGLIARLVELHEGKWHIRASARLDARDVISVQPDTPFPLPVVDTLGAEIAAMQVTLRSKTLLRALKLERSPVPAETALSPRRDDGEASKELSLLVNGLQLLPSAPTLPAGSRGLLEVQLGGGSGLLHAPLVSKMLRLPLAGEKSVTKIDWQRSIKLSRDGQIWKALATALAAEDDEQCNVVFTLVVVSGIGGSAPLTPSTIPGGLRSYGFAGGGIGGIGDGAVATHKTLATGAWNMRRQLLSGRDAVQQRTALLDVRGVPVASLWISLAANEVLEAIVAQSDSVQLPPVGSRKRQADVAFEIGLIVVKLQAAVRGMLRRKHERVAMGLFEQEMRICVHSLRLPPELCNPEAVSAASVHVELAGVVVLRSDRIDGGGAVRPRAGSDVVFETERTLPLERGSIPFNNVRDGLRFGGNKCDLKVSVTAERRLAITSATVLNLLTEQRYSLGEARLDLRELLRTGRCPHCPLRRPLPLAHPVI